MKTYKFQGYSGDTFGEYGVTDDDYDNCASGKPIRWRLMDLDGNGVVVTGQHCPPGVDGWTISVGAVDIENPVGWDIRMLIGIDGTCCIVNAPDETELVCLERQEARDDG